MRSDGRRSRRWRLRLLLVGLVSGLWLRLRLRLVVVVVVFLMRRRRGVSVYGLTEARRLPCLVAAGALNVVMVLVWLRLVRLMILVMVVVVMMGLMELVGGRRRVRRRRGVAGGRVLWRQQRVDVHGGLLCNFVC